MPVNKTRFKCWVFDLDGTLVDSFGFYLRFVENFAARRGVTLTDSELAASLGQSARKFFSSFLPAESIETALEELRAQSVLDAIHIQPFPGIKVWLQDLKK